MRKLLILLLFAFPLHAVKSDTTSTDSMPTYFLGEMFVVAKRVAKWVIPPEKVDLKTIQKQGARTVAEAVKLVPGVDITVGFKNEASLTIQGFTSKRIAVLVDGRPVNNPYYGSADLLSITTDNVSRIDVIQGNIAPTVAVNGMGGIVNIVTEAPEDRPYTRILFDYGSGSTYDFKLNHGRPFSLPNLARLYYALNFYRGASKGFPLPDTFEPNGFEDGGLRDNSDYSRTNIQLKLGYRYGSQLHVGMSVGSYRSSKGVPPAMKMDASFWRFPYWNRDFVDLSGEFRPTVNLSIRGKLYADKFVNDLISYRTREFDPNDIWWNSLHDLRDWGTVWETRYTPSNSMTLKFGLQYRLDKMNRHPDLNAEWRRNTMNTANLVANIEKHTESFIVSAGLSVPFFKTDSMAAWAHILNPQVGVSVSPLSFARTWLYLSRNSRFPTGHELFSTRSGNPHLKPEKATRVQGGISIDYRSVKLSLIGFYNDINDMIDRPSRDSIYRNIAHALTAGSELTVKFKRGNYFDLSFSYTNLIGEDLTTHRILPGISNHKITLSAEYRPSKTQLIRGSIYYRSRRFWPEKILAPCIVANIYTEQVIWGPVKGFISIKNLFDALYEEEPYYPMPGRTITVGFVVGG